MKTEKEIEAAKTSLEKELEAYSLCGMAGMCTVEQSIKLKVLKWVLETPVPKRTVFDLTEQELLELMDIVVGGDQNYIQYDIKKHPDAFIRVSMSFGTIARSRVYDFYIYDNLDFVLKENLDQVRLHEQASLRKLLNELLNKEKVN